LPGVTRSGSIDPCATKNHSFIWSSFLTLKAFKGQNSLPEAVRRKDLLTGCLDYFADS